MIVPITSSRLFGFSSHTSQQPLAYISPPKSIIYLMLGGNWVSIIRLITSRRYHFHKPPNSRIISLWSITVVSFFSIYCHPIECPIWSLRPYPSDESRPVIVGSKYPSVDHAVSSANDSIIIASSSRMACLVVLSLSSQFHSMNLEYLNSNVLSRSRIDANRVLQFISVSIWIKICVPIVSQLSSCIGRLYINTVSCKS